MGDTLNVPQTQPHLATAPAALALENAERIGRAAQLAHEGFLDAAQSTRRRVDAAHGASIQSEAWALAQVALAQLQTHRSATLSALADLDRIYIEAANQGQSLEQISASREEVAALLAQEDQAIGDMLEDLAR